MQKWEYKVTALLNEDALKELGREGWELVGVFSRTAVGHSTNFVFKRPISD